MATLKQFRQKQFSQSRNNGSRPDNGGNSLSLPTKDRVPENGTTPSTGTPSFRVVLQNEDPNAFRTLREALLRDWIPASSFEHALVIDIAEARWRLARYTTFETAAIDFEIERMRTEVDETFDHIDEGTRSVLGFNALILHNRTFHVLQSVIRQQHRIIDRATSQLLRLRKLRPDQGGGDTNTSPGARTCSARNDAPPPRAPQKAQPQTAGNIENRRNEPEPAVKPEPQSVAITIPVAPPVAAASLDPLTCPRAAA